MKFLALVAFLAGACSSVIDTTSPLSGNVRIVFEGTSVTHELAGNDPEDSWRYPLSQSLIADVGTVLPTGTTFDFAGPITGTGQAPTTKHMGVSGSTVQTHIDTNVPTYYGKAHGYNCDLVVLEIGCNDTTDDAAVTAGLAALPTLLSNLQAAISPQRPNVRFVVLNLWFINGRATQVANWNAALPAIIATAVAGGMKITSCDISSVITYPTDYYDGIHPNKAGYAKLAPVIYPAMLTAMGY